MNDRTVLPTDNQDLINVDLLTARHDPLLTRLEAFEAKAENVPQIDTEDEVKPWLTELKNIDALGADIEATRVQVKGPFEAALETANAFFFGLHMPRKGGTPGRLQKARNKIRVRVEAYMARKEAEERQRREAEAARLRQEQAAAEQARRQAEEKRLAAEADERKRAAANAAAKEAQAAAAASVAGARAFEAEQQAAAPTAELSRTRSDEGALGTLKVEWTFTVADHSKVPGRDLWKYATPTQKDAMIRAYIRANAPSQIREGEENEWQPIVGVTMVPQRKLQVR